MQALIWDFLSKEGFQPHGMCLLWRPDVFWAHVISDIVIAGAYFSIPVALMWLALKRRDLIHRWVLVLFSGFIVACGVTHLFGIWTMWVPSYGVQAIAKMGTAAISLTTAVMLWPSVVKRSIAHSTMAMITAVQNALTRPPIAEPNIGASRAVLSA